MRKTGTVDDRDGRLPTATIAERLHRIRRALRETAKSGAPLTDAPLDVSSEHYDSAFDDSWDAHSDWGDS